MIVTASRLHALRRVCETPVEYPSADFEASRSYLAAAVPELLDTIESLCRVLGPLVEDARGAGQ